MFSPHIGPVVSRPREGTFSSIWPVAIRMTWTAFADHSTGRFSPLRPRSITGLAEAVLEYSSQAQQVEL